MTEQCSNLQDIAVMPVSRDWDFSKNQKLAYNGAPQIFAWQGIKLHGSINVTYVHKESSIEFYYKLSNIIDITITLKSFKHFQASYPLVIPNNSHN